MPMSELQPSSKTCIFCGSDNLKTFQAEASDARGEAKVDIVECSTCAFAWQFPLARTNGESIQHFEFAYKDEGKTASAYFDPEFKTKVANFELEFISHLPVDDHQLLDIGAGAGIFAKVASENGWSVTAIDPALDVNCVSERDNL